MAQGSKVAARELAGGWSETEDREDRWPVPYTAMLVTVASAGLWALLIAGARWLIG
jgi:hypothetical protein